MADNTTLNTGTGGDLIATDDIGGVKVQRVKVIIGNDGVNNGDISATNPLPISNAGITSIDTKTPALGQAAMVASTPVVIASNQTAIPVAASFPSVLGGYGCGVSALGTAGAQQLATIENPAASGRTVSVKRISVSAGGTGGAITSAGVPYRMGRTTGIPTGTIATSQKRKTADSAAVGIVRSIPVATFAAGILWVGSLGGSNTAINVEGIVSEPIELAPGEALLVDVGANDVDAFHAVSFYWTEV